MSLCYFLFERFSEISTIALHVYFLYRIMNTKVSLNKQMVAGVLFACARMVYYVLGVPYRPYFSMLSGVLYASVVFVGNMRAYIVWSTILVALDGIVEAVMISLYLMFPNTTILQIDEPGFVRIVSVLIVKGISFVTYYLITRRVDKEHTIQWKDFAPLLLVPIGCWIMLEVVFTSIDILPDNMSQLLLAMGCISLLLIVTSTILLYNRITTDGKELTQSRLQLRTAEITKDHIDQINDIYTKLSSIRHDLKNHFAAISGLLTAKDYPALEQYMTDLVDFEIEMHEFVKHPVLNALISARSLLASNTNIDFKADISLPEELPMTDVDLCILVSNILDNAFEANEGISGAQFIYLYTRVVKLYWVVACKNTTDKQGRFKSTGHLRSTKKNASVHGLGTKQIQKIAEKCGGFVTYRRENYEFTTVVAIKLSSDNR